MTEFDFVMLAILLVSLLLGLWRGLVYEILSLAGWPIAFMLSKSFANSIAPSFPIQQEMTRIAVAYVTVFVVVLIVWGVLVWLLARLIKAIGLGWLDIAMGGLFGVLRGVLVILALVWLAGLTAIPNQPFWHGARMSRTAEDVALLTKSWLPDSIAQRISYGIRG